MTNHMRIGRGLQIFAAVVGVTGIALGMLIGAEDSKHDLAKNNRPVNGIQHQLGALADRTKGHAEVHAVLREAQTAIRRADAVDPVSDRTASRMAEMAARMFEIAQQPETTPEVARVLHRHGERIASLAAQHKHKRQSWLAARGGNEPRWRHTGFVMYLLSLCGAVLLGFIGELIVRAGQPASYRHSI